MAFYEVINREPLARGSRGKEVISLDPASVVTHIAQALDLSGYMKKVLITNKVTTHFFITPFKPISYTLHATTLDLLVKSPKRPLFVIASVARQSLTC